MHRIAFTAFLSLLVVSKTTRTLCTPALTNDADIHIAVDDYSSKEKIGLDLQSLPGDSLLEFSIGSGDQDLDVSTKTNRLSVELVLTTNHQKNFDFTEPMQRNNDSDVIPQEYRTGYIAVLFGSIAVLLVMAVVFRALKGRLCF
ncbi:hypothetical protein NPIL_652612 [Nephila pilipes]|uniref:Uncharacterized protein n=1 Tax=Nephila pilipes TaxID=299642 RepID=A0A8X6MVX7_NEPPI|nr:hypothetical protein NPIL_652612 [Nephila pilipes]